MVVEAQNEIRIVLGRLVHELPKGFVVTGCEVGCVPVGLMGGGREYIFTANITVEVWTE
jgi:hypothetical protein